MLAGILLAMRADLGISVSAAGQAMTAYALSTAALAPLLLSLNASMLYLGTAGGSVEGGLAGPAMGFAQVAWAGLPFLALGLWMLLRSK